MERHPDSPLIADGLLPVVDGDGAEVVEDVVHRDVIGPGGRGRGEGQFPGAAVVGVAVVCSCSPLYNIPTCLIYNNLSILLSMALD